MNSDIRYYIAIDLKSFYASVECRQRDLDPLDTNLVVADSSRTQKTICLAVSPSLKAYGIPGRARLFEVIERVKQVNAKRKLNTTTGKFIKKSYKANELVANADYEIDFIIAPPQMAKYMEKSTEIYNIYLRYIAPEDIHVYSIDEVFIDATNYLKTYNMTAVELAGKMIRDVFNETGITATAGVGTNLYLCKVAMDIVAKHIEPDENGARIAFLDEKTYRQKLWNHTPITDFWRVGRGYAKRLREIGINTMGDIARCSIGGERDYYNEDLLYKMFGVNAELLIDHAWGYEPCTMEAIKSYKPQSNSIGSGQVLQCPYSYEKARVIVWEMTDLLVLDLVEKGLVTNQIVLTVGYDISNLTDAKINKKYKGEVTIDHYGRAVPKHAHGTANIDKHTSSTRIIVGKVMALYEKIVNPDLLVRRVSITANNVIEESQIVKETQYEQLNLFTDYQAKEAEEVLEEEELKKEKRLQQAMISIKKKYGKNAVLKGTNLTEGAMTKERNNQIGGHKA